MTNITGTTTVYGIVADPIQQVKTPQLINPLLEQRQVDGVMVPFHVSAAELPVFLNGLRGMKNLAGLIVTVPHKTSALSLCDEVTPAAATVGAVNVIRKDASGRFYGDILDGKGFVAGLRSKGIEPRGKSAYLVGAGGAANAIAFALAEAGVSSLTLYNRTAAKVQDMIARIARVYPQLNMSVGTEDPAGFELVVNATSLGMAASDPLPVSVANLGAGQIVAEIIMKPERTALLEAAEKKGCQIHFGLPMLQCQIELMADFMGAGK